MAGSRVYAGWRVVVLTFILTMLNAGAVFYAYSVYAVAFGAAFDAPRTLINLGFTAVMVVSGLMAVGVSTLIRWWGMMATGIVGCVGTALGLVCVSFASDIWQVVILYGTIVAVPFTMTGSVLCNSLLALWFERRRGLVMGIMTMGASIAAIAFPPATAIMIEEWGWRASFWAHGALFLAAVPLIWLWAREPVGGIAAHERRTETSAPVTQKPTGLSHKAILRDRDFWGVSLAIGALSGLNGSVLVSLVPYAVAQKVTPTDAAFLVSLIGVTALISKLLAGFLADRMDLRILLRVALFAAVLSQIVLLSGGGYVAWAVAAVLFGIAIGGMLPIWSALFARMYALPDFANIIGWSRTVQTPQTILIPLFAGVLFDSTHSYQGIWALNAALAAMGMAFTLLHDEKPQAKAMA